MGLRFMRIMVFFDLPVETSKNRHDYRVFRKALIKEGFAMIEESVYCKLAINDSSAASIIEYVKKNKPPEGTVMALSVTEAEYANMNFICGTIKSDVLSTTDRLVNL